MAKHGDLCVFKFSSLTDTEANLAESEKVEFNGNAQAPDNRSGVIDITIEDNRTQTQNPAPFQEATKKPDTGFGGNRYILELFFDEDSGAAGGIQRLRAWAREKNDLRGVFREGRIGIRNDWMTDPNASLEPIATRGYTIASFRTRQLLKTPRIIMATLVLELSGEFD